MPLGPDYDLHATRTTQGRTNLAPALWVAGKSLRLELTAPTTDCDPPCRRGAGWIGARVMSDFWQWCSQQPGTVWVDACYYGHQLSVAIGDRLTLANLFKVGLLLFLLWLTLRIIGRVNGIKGNDTWVVQVNQVQIPSRFVRLSRGTIRKNGESISEAIKEYDGRSGTVEFRIPVSYRPWLNKLGLGPKEQIRQQLIFSKNRILEVPLGSSPAQKLVWVDPATAATLATSINRKDLDSDDETRQIAEILARTEFSVTVKRNNRIKFLLSHPDPTLRTTAWVLLVGTLFEITRSVIFEQPLPMAGTVVGTMVGN
jgi:hypothetical protein